MSDITANVVVSMPSQLFTLARAFKAAANGKIYIGTIDTDPTIPTNQIPVYLENEDGSHVQVAQPLSINQGGFPVYGGNIAKFVTTKGHSMAVYDAYGVQQFYYPNVLKYDPDQLEQRLSQPDGYLLVGGLQENFGWPANTIVADRPPFNGDLRAAFDSIPSTGNATIILGSGASYDIGVLNNTKPNVAIVGGRMPKADMTTRTLVAGSGSIIRGVIINSAAGFSLYNLGIDNSDQVRNSILGGAYYDSFANDNFGTNANIQYGNLVIMQANTIGGTIGLRHGIRNEFGSGVRQIGDVYIYMGYHGHVVKCSNFFGESFTTYGQGTHANTVIIKADTGTGAIRNVIFGNVICDGGPEGLPPVATTGGVVLEAAGSPLSGVEFGNVTATNARYACITAPTTTEFISNFHGGKVTATSCDDGTNITSAIRFGVYCVGGSINGHEVRNCTNMTGVQVDGPTTSSGQSSNSVHIGSGQSCNNTHGYNLAGGVSHGPLYGEGNSGYLLNFNGYKGPGSAVQPFSGMSVNTDIISGRANGSGLFSGAPSAIANYIGTWVDSLSFSAQIVGGSVRISGRLAKGASAASPAVQMLSHAIPGATVQISAWGVNGSNVLIPVEANIGTDGILNVPGFASIASTVSFYGEYRIK